MPEYMQAVPQHKSRQEQLSQQEQQVIQQLQQQQTWDLARGQTIQDRHEEHADQLIQQQLRDNQLLAAQAQAQLSAAHAGQAAPGAPVQALAPAEESAKQRREKRRHARAARQQTPYGDHVSYAMHEQIAAFHNRQSALGDDWEKKIRENGNDPEALRGFLRLTHKHMPSKEKTRAEADNRALVEGFASQDLVQREAALQSCVEQMRGVRLSMDLLREDYLEKHLEEVLALQEKLSSFCRLMRDPGFRTFFDQKLSTFDRALLARHLQEAPAFEALLRTRLTQKGVGLDGAYLSAVPQMDTLRQQDKAQADAFLDENNQTETLLGRQITGQILSERLQMRTKFRDAQQAPEFRSLGLNFYSQHPAVAQLDEVRTLIARAPEQYAAHKAEYDRLYQQLFRGTDTLCDLQQEIDAVGAVITRQGEASALGQKAAAQLAALRDEAAQIQRQTNAAADVIRFLTAAQSELSEDGRLLAERESLSDLLLVRQEQVDEALWASDPEALIARVQTKLDRLQFSPHPLAQDGMQPNEVINQLFHMRDESEQRRARQDILGSLDRFSAEYRDQFVTSPRGVRIYGMPASRLCYSLSVFAPSALSLEQANSIWDHLLCGERLFLLRTKQAKSPDAMTALEREELASYTPARLAQMELTFEQGICELKAAQLAQLRVIRKKYGRFLSQLHPEDVIERLGPEYREEIAMQQDLYQILRDLPDHFDTQNDPDDREYQQMTDYLEACNKFMQFYAATSTDGEQEFRPTPEKMELMAEGLSNLAPIAQLEAPIHGQGFNSAEMKAYKEILRRRYTGEAAIRLFGRFAPDADRQP